ncbi:LysR family transcriptional regulator [Ramlibacter rhizophilus]|uniref:LysR family transcriptional regulator n=1 Tax=Ramlibacter rhizophilus TaxID=1781167 RepID=A0A4Z0C091_9BURK|nr:LysR family transcriptional regulator [Ramlibacter rhizophilus]TFZ05017.1 LysR family transcriptional regulator [Ramlibacter rhizophilus]
MSGHAGSLHPKALRYVAAVAQLGSVQAAAREVSISASAVDRQILLLEEDLGVPLFERLPRGMRLTAAGELLLALSQRWKADLNRTLSDIRQLQGVSHGELRLAAMDSHVNGFLPEFVVAVGREHPGIQLEVDIASPDDAVNLLAKGGVDVAVAFNVKPQRELNIIWSAALPLGCAVAANHALAREERVDLKDVAAWPLAVQSRALAIRQYLERRHGWLLEQARPPLVTNSLQLVKSLVRSGGHVALTSELDMGPEILDGAVRFIPLRDKSAQPQSVSVATSAGRSPPRMARIMAELLARHVQDYMARVREAGTASPRKGARSQRP